MKSQDMEKSRKLSYEVKQKVAALTVVASMLLELILMAGR